MTPPPRPAPSHVPTLTEVIELPGEPPALSATAAMPVAPLVHDTPTVPAMPVAMPLIAPTPASVPVLEPVAQSSPPQPAVTALPQRNPSGVDEAAMAQRVLGEVQRQIDGMLEYRLREALTPILARTSESLVRELRQELSKTMRDVVSRAVAQEVARQRGRS